MEIKSINKSSYANMLHEYAINGMFISAVALKIIFDQQLYRELGCRTQTEYCEKFLPFDRTQVFRYIRVADVFCECLGFELQKSADVQKYLTTGDIQNVVPVQQIFDDKLGDIWNLGVKKLYLIATKMQISEVKIFAQSGSLAIGETLFSARELKEMSFDMLVTLLNGLGKETVIIEKAEEKQTVIDLQKESKTILTQARYVRVKLSQLCEYANPSIAAHMGVSVPPELTEKASRLVDLTNRLLNIEEQLENLLTGDKNAN